MAFACEANLQLNEISGFVERGTLGSKDTYSQRVYSGNDMSYSTLIFSSERAFNKNSIISQTAKSMIATVSGVNKTSDPKVKILDKKLLPRLDNRLVFLSYVTHGTEGSINVEASASIKTDTCWSVLRFSALKKQTRDEALNHFASLIRATRLMK